MKTLLIKIKQLFCQHLGVIVYTASDDLLRCGKCGKI